MRCTVWLSALRKCEPLVYLGKWLTAWGTGREGERSKKGKRRILRVRLSWRNWEKAERKELVGPTPCLTVWKALLVCAGQHDLTLHYGHPSCESPEGEESGFVSSFIIGNTKTTDSASTGNQKRFND